MSRPEFEQGKELAYQQVQNVLDYMIEEAEKQKSGGNYVTVQNLTIATLEAAKGRVSKL